MHYVTDRLLYDFFSGREEQKFGGLTKVAGFCDASIGLVLTAASAKYQMMKPPGKALKVVGFSDTLSVGRYPTDGPHLRATQCRGLCG